MNLQVEGLTSEYQMFGTNYQQGQHPRTVWKNGSLYEPLIFPQLSCYRSYLTYRASSNPQTEKMENSVVIYIDFSFPSLALVYKLQMCKLQGDKEERFC